MAVFLDSMSPDERARADRYLCAADRVSFIICRGIVRSVLSRYEGGAPQDLCFEYTDLGKPMIRVGPGVSGLGFSVSHSKDWVLIAVGRYRKIGIDVEEIRLEPDILSIAKRFYAADEFALIQAAPEGMKASLFYEIWTRKEGYVKALGKGLYMPLDSFSVPVDPHVRVRLNQDEDPWLFSAIGVETGYAAALATCPPPDEIYYYQWESVDAGVSSIMAPS